MVPACSRFAIGSGAVLSDSLDGIAVNGAMDNRLPQNLNVRFDGVHGETLLKAIAGHVAVSSGAACATASAEPSHVLRAIGLNDDQARASIRFGLTRLTTEREIDATVDKSGRCDKAVAKTADVRCRLGVCTPSQLRCASWPFPVRMPTRRTSQPLPASAEPAAPIDPEKLPGSLDRIRKELVGTGRQGTGHSGSRALSKSSAWLRQSCCGVRRSERGLRRRPHRSALQPTNKCWI